MTDTPPDIAAIVRERLMARSGAERLEMGARMFEAAREMVLASFPPHLSETEKRRRLYQRFYGKPLPAVAAEERAESELGRSHASALDEDATRK
ncbi:MAG: hypothetical protein M3463_00945 [Verrucomicrobiota bacterium]|nr:hypothetical protein [Verrucomicrobiota bacterium]